MRSRPGSVALSKEAAHSQAAERLALPALWIAAAGLVATRVAGGAAGETAAGAGGELGCASAFSTRIWRSVRLHSGFSFRWILR